MLTERLDSWLPDPAVRTRHARSAAVAPDVLWDAAASVRLNETGTLGRLVRWRISGTPADMTFRELIATDPFHVLAEGDGWSISGLVGRIWTLSRDYPPLDGPDDFLAWDTRGTVKVLFAHWVEDDGNGGATFHSEARVDPTDRWAGMRLKAIWAALGKFERLIGAEPLAVAVRRAGELSPGRAPARPSASRR